MRGAASGDYRWSAVILGIVKSAPFQMRTASSGPATQAVRHVENRRHAVRGSRTRRKENTSHDDHEDVSAAADVPARARRGAGAAAARRDGSGADRDGRRRRRARSARFGVVYVPNGIDDGRLDAEDEGAASSCRRFCSRWRRSGTPAGACRASTAPGGVGAHAGAATAVPDRRRSEDTAQVAVEPAFRSTRSRAGARPADAARVARARARSARDGAGDVRRGYSCALQQHDLVARADDCRCRWRTIRASSSSGCSATAARTDPRGAGERASSAIAASSTRSPTRWRDLQRGLGTGDRPRSTNTSNRFATSSGGFSVPRSRARASCRWSRSRRGIPRTFDEHAKLMFDLQALALSVRPDARDDVHDGPRAQRPRPIRRSACPTRIIRSRTTRTTREDREACTKLNTYHVELLRVVPGEAARHARRRRLAARPQPDSCTARA